MGNAEVIDMKGEESVSYLNALASMKTLEMELLAAVPERDEVIPMILDCLIAGEHVLLLGEPGTAKSYLLELLAGALDLPDGEYFDTLVTRHSEPSEFFGPMSIKGLENDEYRRVTTGMMPEAKLAFLDEVFKGNSAVLNGLLKLINERKFRNGGKMQKAPLRMVMAASNEVPDLSPKAKGDSMAAFFDRFLGRLEVNPLEDDDAFDAMCNNDLPPVTTKISFDDVDALAARAATLPFTKDLDNAIRSIRSTFVAAGVQVSDRRWKAIKKLLRARAARLGKSEVTQEMLPAVMHCAWSKPEQAPVVEEIVEANMATWRADVRSANGALDEMTKRITDATKAVELAEITDQIVEMRSDMNALKAESPEADIQDVLDRCETVVKSNLSKMAQLAGA